MKKRNKESKIGGDFEINPKAFNGYSKFIPNKQLLFFSNGRSALLSVLLYIIKKKYVNIIYIPYYICESVYLTCLSTDFIVRFYELDENYNFPVENINKLEKNSTILIVNYFGFSNGDDIINIIKSNRKDINVIYDCVQALWSLNKTSADYSITSFRKWIAVPDGAIVKTNFKKFFSNIALNVNNFYFGKIIAALLKYSNVNDEDYLKVFETAEQIIDKSFEITRASNFSQYVYENTNWKEIKERRFENYNLVYKIGKKYGFQFMFDYKEGIIPLCIPVFIKNRDVVKLELAKKNIFLAIHWPLKDYNKNSNTAKKISENILSLVIDQRYQSKDIKYQLKSLREILEK